MAICISRRAYGDHLRFRLINEKGEDGKWIWLEFRCQNEIPSDQTLCKDCSYKLPKYKYQANQKCDHGIIGGPYTADSKLYGSPYFLKEIKAGWKISEADEIRAKEAVDKACSNMPRKKALPVEESVTLVKPSLDEPKKEKRKYTKKDPALKKKAQDILLPDIPVNENPLEAKLIEIVAPPIVLTDFIVVKVKKIKSEGKEYYYDSISGKVYGISVNGVGAYKGRYNIENDSVDTTVLDSDCE
jgi:hypothetical protein